MYEYYDLNRNVFKEECMGKIFPLQQGNEGYAVMLFCDFTGRVLGIRFKVQGQAVETER